MGRVTALTGLALAASAGVALAADLGKGQERPRLVRELRFERERPHHVVPTLKVVHVQRRGPPYPVNWRGYPQSR